MPDVFRFVRHCPNGRVESQCRTCGNLFWLTVAEVLRWAHCPHCLMWVTCMPVETLPEHIKAKIHVRDDDCWEWVGWRTAPNSYGRIEGWEDGKRRALLAHRVVWRLLKGPVPEILHHRCHFKPCVNPDHLMPSTRQTHFQEHRLHLCRRGHDLDDPANVYVRKNGIRMCWRCQQDRNKLAMLARADRCAMAGHPPRDSDPTRCKCGGKRLKRHAQQAALAAWP